MLHAAGCFRTSALVPSLWPSELPASAGGVVWAALHLYWALSLPLRGRSHSTACCPRSVADILLAYFLCYGCPPPLAAWQRHGLRHVLAFPSRPCLCIRRAFRRSFSGLGVALCCLSFFGPRPYALLACPGVLLLCSRHVLWPLLLYLWVRYWLSCCLPPLSSVWPWAIHVISFFGPCFICRY